MIPTPDQNPTPPEAHGGSAPQGAMVPPDPPLDHEHLTDLGNARRLVGWFGHDLRYCPPWKKWLVWDGKRWAVDMKGEIVHQAKKTVRALYRLASQITDETRRNSLVRFAIESEARHRIEAMIALAQTEPGIAVTPNELDANPWLLNCRNGTLDLRTGQLRKHRREDIITKLAPVAPDYECDHLCRVPWCVNPDHVEVQAHVENVRRGAARWVPGERQRAKRRCPHGHPYTKANTYIHPVSGGRWCRTCDREKKRAASKLPTAIPA